MHGLSGGREDQYYDKQIKKVATHTTTCDMHMIRRPCVHHAVHIRACKIIFRSGQSEFYGVQGRNMTKQAYHFMSAQSIDHRDIIKTTTQSQ